MVKRVAVVAWLFAILAAPPAPAQVAWPADGWNPKPESDDRIVPLPCGGGMAFRPVGTPMASSPLADRPTVLGQPDADTDYSEYLRQTFVAGSFRNPKGEPVGYMGKYEVTRDQYAAVMTEACANLPSPAGRLPQADVSWLEAIAFTTRMSTWVLRNGKASLPMADESVAFVRLPTEVEWEYAARGGDAVSEIDFSARTYPMPEGLVAHAWHQGARSAAGRAKPVGQLQGNPLKLYDMLGNVAEWVLDPYHLNKVGRDHGRVGGLVARGGDYQTPEAQIRSSLRLELQPFRSSNGEPLRLPTVGFRVALGVMATSGDSKPGEYHAAFEAESQMRTSAADDPVRLLAQMRADATDPVQARGLQRIEQTLREASRLQQEREALAIRALIGGAGAVGRQIRFAENSRRLFSIIVSGIEVYSKYMPDEQLKRDMLRIQTGLQAQIDTLPETRRQLLSFYMLLVGRAAPLAAPARLSDLGRVVVEEMRAQRVAIMPEAAAKATEHVVLAAQGRLPPPDQVERELMMLMPGEAPVAPAPPRR